MNGPGASPGSRPASLASGFAASWQRFPERPALEVDGETWSYARLGRRAVALAARLRELEPAPGPGLTAVLGQRSAGAFAGLLAALFRGHGYVPLHPGFPARRIAHMLERAGCQTVVVGAEAESLLESLLAVVSPGPLFVLADRADCAELAGRWPAHRFAAGASPEPGLAAASGPVAPDPVAGNDVAYLLFTSGSTGPPKGVAVSHANVRHFLERVIQRYDVRETDRLSQLFELTFDLSVFDLFVAWERGACVCCPSARQKLLPRRYAEDAALTIWFSVPSAGDALRRLRQLGEGRFPSLRLALFCGEALPAELAESFQRAAPNAVVENLYGPTEVTIACTVHRFDPEAAGGDDRGLVPIGEPLPGLEALIVDEDLRPVGPGEPGELLLTGPQVTAGYWRDAERTAAAFVTPAGDARVFYRTGDRVRRAGGSGPLEYLGRIDQQIKIQGYRVELGEIESVLRDASGGGPAVALGWPPNPGGADGVVAFLVAKGLDADEVLETCRQHLPPYMVPRSLHWLDELPLNPNGKIDRAALRRRLDPQP